MFVKKPMINWSMSGRMIGLSKGDYLKKFPTHMVVFNANVCTEDAGKIWYGDLDLTLDEKEIIELATTRNEMIYVLRELDARFNNETKPNLKLAIARYTRDGLVAAEK